jgi:hypothetical protein
MLKVRKNPTVRDAEGECSRKKRNFPEVPRKSTVPNVTGIST